jgi:methionyl-tRNA formyltransferase
MHKIKVAVLLDPTNNWIERYIKSLNHIKKLSLKYIFHFFYDSKKVKHYEIVLILGYTKILSNEFLKSNKLSLLIHESGLPKGRGFSPVQWQILKGINKIPVCLLEAVERFDSGDVFDKSYIKLTGYELFDEIREKQAKVSLELIERFLVKYPNFSRRKQKGKVTCYRKRNRQDDKLCLNKTLREQFNHFRTADNKQWPLFFVINGHKYLLQITKANGKL